MKNLSKRGKYRTSADSHSVDGALKSQRTPMIDEYQVRSVFSDEIVNEKDKAQNTLSQSSIMDIMVPIDKFVGRTYLNSIDASEIVPLKKIIHKQGRNVEVFNMNGEPENLPSFRWFKIDKIVYEKDVFFADKFSMLFAALHSEAAQVVLVLNKKDGVNRLFLGARDNNDKAYNLSGNTMKAAIQGFLTGVRTCPIDDVDVKAIANQYGAPAVACVSGVASLRDDKKEEFVQGLERLINSTSSIPSYSVFFVSDSIPEMERISIVNAFQHIYRQISPFEEFQTSLTQSETNTITDTLTEGITNTIGETIGKTITNGTNYTTSETETNGKSISDGYSVGWNKTNTKGYTYTITPFGVGCGGALNTTTSGVNIVYLDYLSKAISENDKSQIQILLSRLKKDTKLKSGSDVAKQLIEGIDNDVRKGDMDHAVGLLEKLKDELISKSDNGNLQHTDTIISQLSVAVSKGDMHQVSDLTQQLVQEANSRQNSRATSSGLSNSKSLQVTTRDLHVRDIMTTIEAQIKRLRNAAPFGLWNCATYFISDNESTSRELANIYKGTIVGEESGLEISALNSWDESSPINSEIVKYLSNGLNPRFIVDGQNVSAGTVVSSKELAIHMALPQSSVPGIVVQTRTSFGRSVIRHSSYRTDGDGMDSFSGVENIDNESITLGRVLNLGKIDAKNDVCIDLDDLSKHAFVTGTTGSGKSNAMYLMLKQIYDSGKKFLVVEPKKGEYKYVLGGLNGMSVYGANPNESKILTINPFSFDFQRGIMVYEHVDRLVEIFNACWPMYAAMPAVLKKSILDAYRSCGWDIKYSRPHDSRNVLFPTIDDVVYSLRKYIDESQYSAEAKGNYKGALETRLMDLTEGATGLILNSGMEIPAESLFDENVIVDLHRIGNSETVSLIMGIIILKLNEYRMSCSGMNRTLSHVTVIEEAHNILKRTSIAQNQESSNLVGKSVEMISNSIAEMRTYGEGFIIVDQSPSQVDMSAIRNTNTKIILNLPDADDRVCAGKSIGLSNDQIEEIGRQKVGEAIVYQNDWEEPVQCAISVFGDAKAFEKIVDEEIMCNESKSYLCKDLVKFLVAGRLNKRPLFDLNAISEYLLQPNIPSIQRFTMVKLINEYNHNGTCEIWKDSEFQELSSLMSQYINKDNMVKSIMLQNQRSAPSTITNLISGLLANDLSGLTKGEIFTVVQCLLKHQSIQSVDLRRVYEAWINNKMK